MSKKRKCFYIREADAWILPAIQALLKEADELGVRCTESDVIINALRQFLEKYKKYETGERDKPPVLVGLKRTIQCPVGKADLFERVEEIVAAKQSAGIHTSFSYELCSLAVAGMTDTIYGASMRQLLYTLRKKGT